MNNPLQFIRPYLGLVILIGSMSIIVCIVVYGILPKYSEITQLQQQIAQQKLKRDELQVYASYLEELASSTLEVEEDLVDYALPSENDVISLIVTYEGLSKTENLTVSPFELSPGLVRRNKKTIPSQTQTVDDTGQSVEEGTSEGTTDSGGIKVEELPFKMEIKTEDQQLALDFIKSIYKTRRTFTIKTLSWTNPIPGSTDKEIVIDLDLLTYYYPSAPVGIASQTLVNKGKEQTEFIQQLRDTYVYEDLVLDGVQVGKQDLFRREADNQPNVEIQEKEATTAAIISPVVAL